MQSKDLGLSNVLWGGGERRWAGGGATPGPGRLLFSVNVGEESLSQAQLHHQLCWGPGTNIPSPCLRTPSLHSHPVSKYQLSAYSKPDALPGTQDPL
jgi:hypothetical protein